MTFGFLGNRQWQLAFGTLIAAALLFAYGRGTLSQQGKTVNYTVTVVPADATNLNCAMDNVVGGLRCAFGENQQPRAVEQPLRPYVTTNRELLLLKGVFESQAVASWLDTAKKRGDETRVTLDCRGRVLAEVTKVFVRWSNDGAFQPEANVTVAEIVDCSVRP